MTHSQRDDDLFSIGGQKRAGTDEQAVVLRWTNVAKAASILVASLNRPGGTLTGYHSFAAGKETGVIV